MYTNKKIWGWKDGGTMYLSTPFLSLPFSREHRAIYRICFLISFCSHKYFVREVRLRDGDWSKVTQCRIWELILLAESEI